MEREWRVIAGIGEEPEECVTGERGETEAFPFDLTRLLSRSPA